MIPSDPLLRRELGLSMLGMVVGALLLPLAMLLLAMTLKPGEVPSPLVLFIAPMVLVSLWAVLWTTFRLSQWTATGGRIAASVMGAWVLIQAGSTVFAFRPESFVQGFMNALLLLFMVFMFLVAVRSETGETSTPRLSRWEHIPFLWGMAVGAGAELLFSGLGAYGSHLVHRFPGHGVPIALEAFAAFTTAALLCQWTRRRWPGLLLAILLPVAALTVWIVHHHFTQNEVANFRLAWTVPLGLALGTAVEWRKYSQNLTAPA